MSELFEDRLGLLQAMLDANPAMIFVVDEDVRVYAWNRGAERVLNRAEGEILGRRGGDVLHCINHGEDGSVCGQTEECGNCLIRGAVRKAREEDSASRNRSMLELRRGEEVISFFALITAVPFHHDGQDLVLLTIEDINELAKLWSILPVCSVCKKVRDDQQDWSEMEQYLKTHHDMKFTHGYCPECQEKILKNQI